MENLSSWNEKIVDHKTEGIEKKNIPKYIGLLKESLNLKHADSYKSIFEEIEETINTCPDGCYICKSVAYEKDNTNHLAILHILKDQEGLITVAYAVHKIAYNMQNGSSETGLGDMEQYQRERAEARLKMLGFDVTYELTQLQRELPSLEDENQGASLQKSGEKTELIDISKEDTRFTRFISGCSKIFSGCSKGIKEAPQYETVSSPDDNTPIDNATIAALYQHPQTQSLTH